MSVPVCTIDPALQSQLKEFRFRRDSASTSTSGRAIVMKIDRDSMTLVADETFDDVSANDLRDELPERQPRFVVYSFPLSHDQGRVSFPMCLLFSTPRDCKTELQVMYAGSKLNLVKEAGLTKVFEIRDLEELTEEWLAEKLRH